MEEGDKKKRKKKREKQPGFFSPKARPALLTAPQVTAVRCN
jgi:hypothetical protein